MPKRGSRISEKTRQRLSRASKRYWERRRAASKVSAADLHHAGRTGTARPALRPFIRGAEEETLGLIESLGGGEGLSAQRAALVHDYARLGVVLRAALVRFTQTEDYELVGKITGLVNSRRATLLALGLNRIEREVDLQAYLAQRGRERGSSTEGEAEVVEE